MRNPNTDILHVLERSDMIQFNGEYARPDFLYVPAEDEPSHPDDVVLEISVADDEVDFTLSELENAKPLGEGTYLLEDRGLLRCLSSAILH